MEIIPAISIRKGDVVTVADGEYEVLVDSENYIVEPADLIKKLSGKHEKFLIMDIDGITRNDQQFDLIQELSEEADLWVDAGVRTAHSAMDVLIAGASQVVVGTKTLLSVRELRRVLELSENVIFSIDYKDGIVSLDENIEGEEPFDLLREMKAILNEKYDSIFDDNKFDNLDEEAEEETEEENEKPDVVLEKVIFADLGNVGANQRPRFDIVKRLSEFGYELYVGGGVTEGDTRELETAGAAGAIVEIKSILNKVI